MTDLDLAGLRARLTPRAQGEHPVLHAPEALALIDRLEAGVPHWIKLWGRMQAAEAEIERLRHIEIKYEAALGAINMLTSKMAIDEARCETLTVTLKMVRQAIQAQCWWDSGSVIARINAVLAEEPT